MHFTNVCILAFEGLRLKFQRSYQSVKFDAGIILALYSLGGYTRHFMTEVFVNRNVEQASLGIVGFRWPVFATPNRGAESHRSAYSRDFLWVICRAARDWIDTGKHVLLHIGFGIQKLNPIRRTFQEPEIAVTACVHKTFAYFVIVIRNID